MTALEQLDRTILLCRDYVADGLNGREICDRFQSVKVLCVSDLANLRSLSGQTALVTLVSLLCRMGMRVGLDIPEVSMLAPQPPLSGSFLREALLVSSETLIAGATVGCHSSFRPDLVFVLGDTKFVGNRSFCWRVIGSDWWGALATENAIGLPPWTAKWPIGSMVGAALGANEALKFALRGLPMRDETNRVYLETSKSCGWDFGAIPLPENGLDLGNVDFISAGAISQASLYALLRLPNVRMRGRIFDDDVTGPSNLNRNMLTLVSDVYSQKVELVARRCGTKLCLEPIATRFVANGFEGTLAQRVLIGVDHIPSRWEVQRHTRGWIAVGGTSHFNISCSSHRPGEPCCGCLHPVDDSDVVDPIPTVSFVSFWAGLASVVRLIREALGASYSLERQHLWLTPLRMDQRHAAMWLPVAPRKDCPVQCSAARNANLEAA
jgi:hypothetical protein